MTQRLLIEYVKEDRGYKTKCWIWQGAINKETGYGHCGRPTHLGEMYAHRYMYKKQQVTKMKKLRSQGLSYYAIGNIFDVYDSVVRKICLGNIYKEYCP